MRDVTFSRAPEFDADTLDWFAKEAKRIYGTVIPARADNVSQVVTKHPVGPVAAFTPWNFPLNQAVRKVSIARPRADHDF